MLVDKDVNDTFIRYCLNSKPDSELMKELNKEIWKEEAKTIVNKKGIKEKRDQIKNKRMKRVFQKLAEYLSEYSHESDGEMLKKLEKNHTFKENSNFEDFKLNKKNSNGGSNKVHPKELEEIEENRPESKKSSFTGEEKEDEEKKVNKLEKDTKKKKDLSDFFLMSNDEEKEINVILLSTYFLIE